MNVTDVFILFGHDPYEEHDSPELIGVFTTSEVAWKCAEDRFAYTFGRDSINAKRNGARLIESYYSVAEVSLETEWVTPDWILKTLARREAEWQKVLARATAKNGG